MLRLENVGYRHAHADRPALAELHLELAPGRILLLTGASGSGKSTLLSILSGLVPHYFKGDLSGQVRLDGEEPSQMSLADWGLRVGLMLQNPEAQFLAASVAEEVALTLRCRGITGPRASGLVEEALDRFGLAAIRDRSVFQLSEGQKQKVVLAGLTAWRPKLLLLDEPTANLDPDSIADLGATLAALKTSGLSLVIADHRLSWLSGLVDQVLVLEEGRVALSGDWGSLRAEGRRERLHLRSLEPSPPLEAGLDERATEPGVALDRLSFAWPGQETLFHDFSARLPYGRVTVLTGPSGRGKTTLARLLAGLEKPADGQIRWDGETAASAGELCQVVLQNADHQLYMPSLRAEVGLTLAISHGRRPVDAEAVAVLAEFGLSGLAERHPQSLSGGEKQRLVVAAGLAAPARLLILDEPTSGLDGHSLLLMAGEIKKAAQRGLAVLVITHDLELGRLCADAHLRLPDPA
ncbi:MAG: ATP-binding cassette domain-containing protein [Candidatus Adiutrix sp.]|jgi:energy-coupling factor transport system ATP-binding protein|nr:ATP-binding cassette domain-containing protein [Candidatus Adiutrix sp.]